jgi:signal transduction histidine kinase
VQLFVFAVVEAALRFGPLGGILVPLAGVPVLAAAEWWRADRFGDGTYDLDHVTFPAGIQLIVGLIVGRLVNHLRDERSVAEEEAAAAASLRDEVGRRADQLEAVNRCARALGSTLDVNEAFARFLREVRGVLPFERLAIVLSDGTTVETMAQTEAALFGPGRESPLEGSLVERVLAEGTTVVRADLAEGPRYPEEERFLEVGLRSRVAAPLASGARRLGILSVARRAPHAFSQEEVDLVSLLARQVGAAVQNIRMYETERSTAQELRRLSELRADFVSLVSHELRGPMASVIGCAATLRQRWRSLTPEQRESFLALIEEETSRLASLVGDVLDTSRIEAGTFSYTFERVDMEELVREVVGGLTLAQEEVGVQVEVPAPLPAIRGDRDRLRQVLLNLVSNAVKYTHPGDVVQVLASARNGSVSVRVVDHGPGIAQAQQQIIFEKFGRANVGGKAKPGTGLGLYIARSIAEAHGGSLEVDSRPGEGAAFVLTLPTEA